MPPHPAPELRTAPELSAGRRWWIVCLLALALFINYVDRGALPTAAHLIQDELGFSPRQLGVLFSAFFWSYALLLVPVGWLAEHFGAQRVLACGLTIWACATVLVGVAHSFTALLLLRLLLGVGESAGFPSVCKVLAVAVPVERLGIANGIVAFGYLFGPAVGAYCGGLLMVQFGWRSAFWVFGTLSLLWLLPWSQVRLPQHAAGVSSAGGAGQAGNANPAGGAAGASRTATGGAGASPAFRSLLRQRSLWGTSLGLFSVNYTFYFMLSWLPYYVVRERGFSTGAMAALTGSAWLVNAVTAVIAGWAIDKAVRAGHINFAYKSTMGVAHVGSVACMLCIALASAPWALGAIFLYQVLSGISSPGCFAIPQILAGPSASGRWIGVHNGVGNLAGIIAPWLTGLLVDVTQHFTAAFVLAAILNLLGLVGWLWLVPRVAPIDWAATGEAAA